MRNVSFPRLPQNIGIEITECEEEPQLMHPYSGSWMQGAVEDPFSVVHSDSRRAGKKPRRDKSKMVPPCGALLLLNATDFSLVRESECEDVAYFYCTGKGKKLSTTLPCKGKQTASLFPKAVGGISAPCSVPLKVP